MTYTRGDNRKLIKSEARQHGWTWTETETVTGDIHMLFTRRESNVLVVWSPRDTVRYASINIQGTAGYIPAAPRMALVQTREWLSAPGEPVTK